MSMSDAVVFLERAETGQDFAAAVFPPAQRRPQDALGGTQSRCNSQARVA